MSGNDWNNLGRDVKNIVQNAIDTGDFGRLWRAHWEMWHKV